MTNDVATSQSFEDKMKARIKESIGDLITDEELKKLVDRAMYEVFFAPRQVKVGWDTKTMPPFLHDIIQAEMKTQVAQAVNGYISDHKDEVMEAIKQTLAKGAGEAIVSAVASRFSNDLYLLQQNILNNLNRT